MPITITLGRYGTKMLPLGCENYKNDGPEQKKRETDLGAKPKTFFRPIVELGTITETTHGLKTLA